MKPKAPREGVFSIFSSSGVVGGRDGARGQISRHRVEAQEIQTLRLAPLRETGSKRAYKKNFRAPQPPPIACNSPPPRGLGDSSRTPFFVGEKILEFLFFRGR